MQYNKIINDAEIVLKNDNNFYLHYGLIPMVSMISTFHGKDLRYSRLDRFLCFLKFSKNSFLSTPLNLQ